MISASTPYALGIDLGGTNVKVLAVTRAARVLAFADAPCGRTTRSWTTAVRRTVADVCDRFPVAPGWIGVAAPGLPARDGRSIAFMPARLPGLEGLDWQEFLQVGYDVPVLNDAQAALVGETWCGAAKGVTNAILLTLGTGVGGAALVDGRVLHGHLGRAGHLGHVSLDPGGTLDIVNTPGSLEDAIGDCTIAQRSEGRFASTAALVSGLASGDRHAKVAWRRSIRALAAAIASFVNVLDPEVVVIGGGIARCGPVLFTPLRQEVARFEWRPAGARVRIVAAKLGDRAGAFGAARYAIARPGEEDIA
jgi:glucokinase